jgi:hypothetical protein
VFYPEENSFKSFHVGRIHVWRLIETSADIDGVKDAEIPVNLYQLAALAVFGLEVA